MDLFHRRGSRELSLKEALLRCSAWVGLALLFSLGVYYRQNGEKAIEFLAG